MVRPVSAMLLETAPKSLDRHYFGASPQLLARVRQNWSALGIDLDLVWRETIPVMPGFRAPDLGGALEDSRPMDLLLLFDQAFAWVDTLWRLCDRLGAAATGDEAGDMALAPEQARGLAAVAARLREEMAAVRTLALAGLATPAMQISRSVSEDVDLGLAILVRRRLAQAFTACRTPEDAAEFWRRHVAGGRAFRLVAQALYSFGLDHSEDSDYGRWRKEVLVFLGAAVHTSFLRRAAAGAGTLNPAAQECLYFATVRVQEMCAYAMVLGRDLRADLARLDADTPSAAARLRFGLRGGDILVDQMRWLTDAGEATEGLPPVPRRPLH